MFADCRRTEARGWADDKAGVPRERRQEVMGGMGSPGLSEAHPGAREPQRGGQGEAAGHSGRPPVALRPSTPYQRTLREVTAPCLGLGGSSALSAGRKQMFFTNVFFEKWKAMPCNGSSTIFNYKRKPRPFSFWRKR